MMNHIMQSSPLTKLDEDGLVQLRSADDIAVIWLRDRAVKVMMK